MSVHTPDVISRVGLVRYLEAHPEVEVVPAGSSASVDVVVLAPPRLTPQVLTAMRKRAALSPAPVVLLANQLSDGHLLAVVECRVVAVLPRSAASDDRLLRGVLGAAARAETMPSDLLGELITHLERLRGEGLMAKGSEAAGLNPREVDVLRLMSKGMDTAEIARELCYSERTVKNVIYGCTSRLNLRNRPHAVAYAMRAGAI
ncbi:helix-turn-helix transcriptional regulator [Actinophytocola xanthii]|uniref:helix-turn-helix transcriptional regulator n=1 Tax=Actinophytocola xanthii TaxID=1912961 RepID=UPI001E4B37FC|nr:response regulator transcription factor [Actinophytocola xanthii]